MFWFCALCTDKVGKPTESTTKTTVKVHKGGHLRVPNVSHPSGWETTVVIFWVELIPQNMTAVFYGPSSGENYETQKTTAPGENEPIHCQSTPVFLTQQEIERIKKGYNPDRGQVLLQAKNRLIKLKQSVLTLEQELNTLSGELDQL